MTSESEDISPGQWERCTDYENSDWEWHDDWDLSPYSVYTEVEVYAAVEGVMQGPFVHISRARPHIPNWHDFKAAVWRSELNPTLFESECYQNWCYDSGC